MRDHVCNVDIATSSVQIDLGASHKRRPVKDFVANIHNNDSGSSEIYLEECIRVRLTSYGEQCSPELSDEYEPVENKADPGSPDTDCRLESKLIESMSMIFPGVAEPNVA